MRIRTIAATLLTTALLGAAIAAPAQAGPAHKPLGNKSLAAVLTSDGNRFDKNAGTTTSSPRPCWPCSRAKPNSPVGVLADGNVPLTAFIPNDCAFQVAGQAT